MSTQRERRLFEALYALAKAADRVIDGDGGQALRSLEAALVEANRALAYREDQALGDPK